MVGARCYIIPPPPMTFHLSLGAGYLLMSVPHCSAWLRSWALLRLARISPSFKRECSMAVQEASREKEMQEHDGKQERERLAPKSWSLAPPGPTKPRRKASPEGYMDAGGLRAACTISRRRVHTNSGAPRNHSQRPDF